MRKFFSVLMIVGLLAGFALAADPVAAPAVDNRLSLNANVDWTTANYFRGINLVDNGLIFLPSVNAKYEIAKQQGILDKVSLVGGMFNVVANTGDTWQEVDFNVGVEMGIGNFTLTPQYVAYLSPLNRFQTIHEVDVTLAYDDSTLWKNVKIDGFKGLQPYVTFAQELANSRAANDEGSYLEFGINPGLAVYNDVTLNLPTKVGISVDDYYGAGAGCAFFSTGPVLNVPINKNISVHAGVECLWFTDQTQPINGGDGFQVIGTVGLSLSL